VGRYKSNLEQRMLRKLEGSLLRLPNVLDLLFLLSGLLIFNFIFFLSRQSNIFVSSNLTNQITYSVLLSRWDRKAFYFMDEIFTNLSPVIILIFSICYYFIIKCIYYGSYKPHELPENQKDLKTVVYQYSRLLKLTQPPQIIWSSTSRLYPSVFWFKTNKIFITKSFIDSFSSHIEERNAIILHELSHIKRGDIWKTLLIQCLSAGYLILISTILILRIAKYLSTLAFTHSYLMHTLQTLVPILFSSLLLLFLNHEILRQREIQADRLAAFHLENIHPLRNALVMCENVTQPKIILSFNNSQKKNVFTKIFRSHPSAKQRNFLLFNNHALLKVPLGLAFVIGFLSIMSVEVTLFSLGIDTAGLGIQPLLSVGLDILVGISSIGILFYPAILTSIKEDRKINIFALVFTLLLVLIFWASGAFVSGIFTQFFEAKDTFYRQSIWAFFTTYFYDYPLCIGSASLIYFSFLWLGLKEDRFIPSKNPTFRLFVIPIFLTVIPYWIIFATQAFNFEEYFGGGLESFAVRRMISTLLVYIGIIFIYIRSVISKPQKPNVSIKKHDDFIGLPIRTKKIDGIAIPIFLMFFFAILWGYLLPTIRKIRLKDFREKDYIYQLANKPPRSDVTNGYIRYSDSEVLSSVSFPRDWIVDKNIEYPLRSLIAHNSEHTIKLIVTSYPLSFLSTPEEMLRIQSELIFSGDTNGDHLFTRATPISLNTKAGNSSGYTVSFISPHGISTHIETLFDLHPLFEGIAYQISARCHPAFLDECQAHYQEVINSFDLVSPDLHLMATTSNENYYQDSELQVKFSFPLNWTIWGIEYSDSSTDPPALLLPDENPAYWKHLEITRDDEMEKSSIDAIYITYLIPQFHMTAEERVLFWSYYQSSITSEIRTFIEKDVSSISKSQYIGYKVEFSGSLINYPKYEGAFTVIEANEGLWQLLFFCDQYCNETKDVYENILETLTLNIMVEKKEP
jgi:Zn-dependent protease with chaperone function